MLIKIALTCFVIFFVAMIVDRVTFPKRTDGPDWWYALNGVNIVIGIGCFFAYILVLIWNS